MKEGCCAVAAGAPLAMAAGSGTILSAAGSAVQLLSEQRIV
jgi:hypothetical protein